MLHLFPPVNGAQYRKSESGERGRNAVGVCFVHRTERPNIKETGFSPSNPDLKAQGDRGEDKRDRRESRDSSTQRELHLMWLTPVHRERAPLNVADSSTQRESST